MAYMNDYPEFASFLHNPWAYPTKEEQAAITATKRHYRFNDGDINVDLKQHIKNFFGNQADLHKYGLVKHFNAFQKYVEEKKLIGYILYATTLADDEDIEINKYQTNTGAIITLTAKSIKSSLE